MRTKSALSDARRSAVTGLGVRTGTKFPNEQVRSMIGIVLATHGRLAAEFRAALEHVAGPQKQIESIAIGPDDDIEQRRQDIVSGVTKVNSGAGVVVLTDTCAACAVARNMPGPHVRHSLAYVLLRDGTPYGPDAIYGCCLIFRLCLLPLFSQRGCSFRLCDVDSDRVAHHNEMITSAVFIGPSTKYNTCSRRETMAIRTSEAEWRGDLKGGQGEIKLGSGAFTGSYSFHSRFEDGKGTNPEELIAAAHAGCFSMALAATLAAAGHPPAKIHTTAKVHFGPVPGGFAISRIELATEGSVPGIDAATFEKTATEAKENCPVSQALKAVEIRLSARLV